MGGLVILEVKSVGDNEWVVGNVRMSFFFSYLNFRTYSGGGDGGHFFRESLWLTWELVDGLREPEKSFQSDPDFYLEIIFNSTNK